MNVAANIGYGLRMRGASRDAIAKRVGEMLKLLQLEGYGERSIAALSGGQKQRVALGRALAVDPSVLLLDEPMSNLDYRVRLELRHELRALQKRVGITAVYVTHDREEALTLADRIAVIDAGRIAQLGTPDEVFHRPVSPFVAGFMGADNAHRRRAAPATAGRGRRPRPHGGARARAHFRADRRGDRRARQRARARRARDRRHDRAARLPRHAVPLPDPRRRRRSLGRGPAAPRRRRAGPRRSCRPTQCSCSRPPPEERRRRFALPTTEEKQHAHHPNLRYAPRSSPPAPRSATPIPDARADDAQRRHRRRPEHGRLRQQLPRARSSRC